MPITRHKEESNRNMKFLQSYASFPSSMLHLWITELLRLGYKKPLTLEDLGCLPEEHLVAPNHQKLKEAMLEEMNTASEAGRKPSLLKVVCRISWRVVLPYGLLRGFGELFVLVTPFALSGIITYVDALETQLPQKETFHFISLHEFFTNGFVLLAVIFVANVIERFCLWTAQYMLIVESVHIRTALQAAVYEKSLQLSSLADSKGQANLGQITNYMSSDATNILMAIQMVHFVIIPPLTLAALLLLFNTLGISAACGMIICVILFPVIVISSKKISVFQKKAMVYSDERVKHIHQLLKEIKLVKLNAWEELFCQVIERQRMKEVQQICYKNLVFAVAGLCSNATPILMTIVSFGTYTLFNGKPLTPEIAFPSLALFSLFDRFLFMVPVGLSTTATGYVSIKRLQNFLLTPDTKNALSTDGDTLEISRTTSKVDQDTSSTSNQNVNGGNHIKPAANGYIELKQVTSERYHTSENETTSATVQTIDDSVMVQLVDCNFSWNNEDAEPVLRNINAEIKKGDLTMIVGPVGSGKSALLGSILGEMFLTSGKITFPCPKPSMAFVAQRPWIQNATLRDNVLCGLELDTQRYNAVITSCALGPDIDLLPDGDLTEIGERGITLSGGQKQRVNVARAIYSKAQLILLDDPLSALDGHVSSQVFESGIMGLLRKNNRTVVLVTNQLQYLKHADKVVVFKNTGEIYHQGSYSMIIKEDETLLKQWSESMGYSKAELNTLEMERAELQQQVAQQLQYQEYANQERKVQTEGMLNRQTGERGVLVKKEEMARGSVVLPVYSYLVHASGWSLAVFIVGFGVVQALYLGKDFWLAEWSEEGERHPNEAIDHLAYFIGGYAGISLATILVFVASQFIHTFAAFTCEITLHKAMLGNVSKLPLRFFDTNPLGRILNRFSNDMNLIDMKLFRTIDGSVYSMWRIIFCFIAIIIVAPVFCIVAVAVGIVYFFIQRFYLKSSRELQRIENVCKSPVYAHFSETLDGLSTIRAFGFQKRFFNTLFQRIDIHSTAYLYLRTASVWLNFRLDLMGAGVVLLAGLSTMLGVVTSDLSPALVALAIVYAQRAAGGFGYLITWLSNLEIQMNSVERVKHYALLPTEQYDGIIKPPSDWPKEGVIKFEDVTVKYADDLDPVLNRINLQFNSQEKIGICGRTGSGKSSLVLALFRCNVISKGCIYIDDINTSDVPLTTLRRQLAIIPQDPSLFTGTIRRNLDPEGTKSDAELWHALDIAQLKSPVAELKGGLDAVVTEGGENFSVGQRQLFCLARAFLRKSRILIMDEATASVDTETAKVLQDTLTSAFVDRTVVTIAHRVSSIMECDRIVVMKEGKVAEFDTPEKLLADQNSIFRSIVLANEGGVVTLPSEHKTFCRKRLNNGSNKGYKTFSE
ncbi:ATP-binding cassette sub-family C member 9-like [Amphiura filiformis]|uniref:ATP-binding cassette sub-family C member 9-like n=1 Tax=Amphiura filiformis TaxID=82378 RepID=UPI003B20D68E